MRAPRYQCFSYHMNNRQPWQLKKSKSWGLFWSYQLDSSANPVHLPQNWAKWAELAVLFRGSSKTAPKILIFLIAIGANYPLNLISIETYATQFIGLNKFFLGSVNILILSLFTFYNLRKLKYTKLWSS